MLCYGHLVEFLATSEVRNLIFLGKAGFRMHALFRQKNIKGKNLRIVANLEEAFEIIPAITAPGKICLLSPAAASYDIFRNFEERGSIFKKLARSL
jgi:UDP-N-acetylmuramoylalanine--D-glutamate ligase